MSYMINSGEVLKPSGPRVVIEIKGGEVHAVYSDNQHVSVTVVDWDRMLAKDMTMKERKFMLTHATKNTPHKVHENNGV